MSEPHRKILMMLRAIPEKKNIFAVIN